jgi:hypothetical protein
VCYLSPSDKLSVEEGKRLVEQFISHELFVPGMATVWDLSYVDVSEWDRSAMIAFGRWVVSLEDKRGEAVTVLVAPDDATFGLARMLENWGDLENYNLEVVRSMEEADDWLREQGY